MRADHFEGVTDLVLLDDPLRSGLHRRVRGCPLPRAGDEALGAGFDLAAPESDRGRGRVGLSGVLGPQVLRLRSRTRGIPCLAFPCPKVPQRPGCSPTANRYEGFLGQYQNGQLPSLPGPRLMGCGCLP